MTQYDIEKMLREIDQLPKLVEFSYASRKGNSSKSCSIVSVDLRQRKVVYRRNGEDQTIVEKNLLKLAEALNNRVPFDINETLSASGNFRAALEAIIARTPNVFLCEKEGRKHLFWDPNSSHDPGKIVPKSPPSDLIGPKKILEALALIKSLANKYDDNMQDSCMGWLKRLESDVAGGVVAEDSSLRSFAVKVFSFLFDHVDGLQKVFEKVELYDAPGDPSSRARLKIKDENHAVYLTGLFAHVSEADVKILNDNGDQSHERWYAKKSFEGCGGSNFLSLEWSVKEFKEDKPDTRLSLSFPCLKRLVEWLYPEWVIDDKVPGDSSLFQMRLKSANKTIVKTDNLAVALVVFQCHRGMDDLPNSGEEIVVRERNLNLFTFKVMDYIDTHLHGLDKFFRHCEVHDSAHGERRRFVSLVGFGTRLVNRLWQCDNKSLVEQANSPQARWYDERPFCGLGGENYWTRGWSEDSVLNGKTQDGQSGSFKDFIEGIFPMLSIEKNSEGECVLRRCWTYDEWTRAVRFEFSHVDAEKFLDTSFDYLGFMRRFIYDITIANSYFKDHTDEDRRTVGNFLSQERTVPHAISWYLDDANKPPVVGMVPEVMLNFMMNVHPEEFATYSGMVDRMLVFTGFLKEPSPKKITIESYETNKNLQGQVLAKMRELGIGKAADDDSPADYLTVYEFARWLNDEQNMNLVKEKVMASKYKPTEITKVEQKKFSETEVKDFKGFVDKLVTDVADVGLKYAPDLMKRFVCAQLSKPFVVLTGLSGSGKTKLAQAFTTWLGVDNTYRVVPVGADWTNNEKLLGYPNALDSEKYVLPDTGVLKLMLDAALPENEKLPFFLILDEMNLSHVERYFADFLSAMESGDEIKLYDGQQRHADDGTPVPQKLKFPKNLFVIGTMNVDETTYMFSPKVLDRAQVIEFRVSEKEITDFLAAPANPKIDDLAGKGAAYAEAFLALAAERKAKQPTDDELAKVKDALAAVFPSLAELGAEFGYRSAIEILTFVAYYLEASGYSKLTQSVDKEKYLNDAIDAGMLQKLLPKLHGSLNRLGPVLDALIGKVSKTKLQANNPDAAPEIEKLYPQTYEKLLRMKDRVEKNGFTSFAEA